MKFVVPTIAAVALLAACGDAEPAPTAAASGGPTLSSECGIATAPGIVLNGWVQAKDALQQGDITYLEDLTAEMPDVAQDVQANCPSDVAALGDAVLKSSVALEDGLQAAVNKHPNVKKSSTVKANLKATAALQSAVDGAVKAYWIATSGVDNPEQAYTSAVDAVAKP